MWTRSLQGKTEGRQLASGSEVDKVSGEVANYKQFLSQVEQIVEVNEAICEARPIPPLAGEQPSDAGTEPEKGGSTRRSKRTSPKR